MPDLLRIHVYCYSLAMEVTKKETKVVALQQLKGKGKGKSEK